MTVLATTAEDRYAGVGVLLQGPLEEVVSFYRGVVDTSQGGSVLLSVRGWSRHLNTFSPMGRSIASYRYDAKFSGSRWYWSERPIPGDLYFICGWSARLAGALSRQSLEDAAVCWASDSGVLQGPGLDTEVLCERPLHLISAGGCAYCPAQATCVSSLPSLADAIPSSTRALELVVEAAREAAGGGQTARWCNPRAVQGGEVFTLESWPDTLGVDFSSEEAGLEILSDATKAQQASLKFGKEHCSGCLADCAPKHRRYCAEVLTPASILRMVEGTISTNTGWDPSTLRWDNVGVQAGLALAKVTDKFVLPMYGDRPVTWRFGNVTKDSVRVARPPRWHVTGHVPKKDRKYLGYSVSVSKTWGREESYTLPLVLILSLSQGARRVISGLTKERRVPLSRDLTIAYAFLSSLATLSRRNGWGGGGDVAVVGVGYEERMKALVVYTGAAYQCSVYFSSVANLHKPWAGIDFYMRARRLNGYQNSNNY